MELTLGASSRWPTPNSIEIILIISRLSPGRRSPAQCWSSGQGTTMNECKQWLNDWSRYGSGCYEYECSGGGLSVVIRNVSFPCTRAGLSIIEQKCIAVIKVIFHHVSYVIMCHSYIMYHHVSSCFRSGDTCRAYWEKHWRREVASHRYDPNLSLVNSVRTII